MKPKKLTPKTDEQIKEDNKKLRRLLKLLQENKYAKKIIIK